MRKSIFVDDQSSPEYAIEYTNPCYPNNRFGLQTQVNPCLWTNLGPKSHETTSTHTLQAQGRRSTVALLERTEAHRECRPGAKSKNIAPYARGTKVIGKVDRGARKHPGTSMFQKGLPQNLRVPRESVPRTPSF